MNFLNNKTIFNSRERLLPVYNMASSGLKKMLILTILYTQKSVSENVCPVILFWTPNFFDNLNGSFYVIFYISKGMPRQMLLPWMLW